MELNKISTNGMPKKKREKPIKFNIMFKFIKLQPFIEKFKN